MVLGNPDLTAMLAIGYDAWAPQYDVDMDRYGYCLPSRMVDEAQRHIGNHRALMLDAGAGSGLLGQALRAGGYVRLVGLDPSLGMLREAHAKKVYILRLQMALGPFAALADHRFDAILAAGVFKAGHAPPEAMEELVRLVRPEGIIILNLEAGTGGEAYERFGRYLTLRKRWRRVGSTGSFSHLPGAAPEMKTVIHIFQTTSPACFDGQTRDIFKQGKRAHGLCNP